MISLLVAHCIFGLLLFHFIMGIKRDKVLKYVYLFVPNLQDGRLLYTQLLGLRKSTIGKSVNNQNRFVLVKYKYFTDMIQQLIQSTITYGTEIDKDIPEIKKALLKDINLDMKISNIFLGGLFQFLFIFFLGIVFVKMVEFQIGIVITASDFSIPFIFQGFGVVFYLFSYYYFKQSSFRDLSVYIIKFYQVRTLSHAQLPLKKIFTMVSPLELRDVGDLKYFKERLINLLEGIRVFGHVDMQDFDLTINELWQVAELRFDQFSKKINLLKLVLISFFSLGGYLILLFKIFGNIGL